MPGLMRLAPVVALSWAGAVWADGSLAYTLRAVGPHISDAVIRHVALNSRPRIVDAQEFAGGAPLTARALVARLCGSFREAYWAELVEANRGLALAADKPVPEPGRLVWPQCLYVQLSPPGTTVTVASRETASQIYMRLTGSHGTPATHAKFFSVASAEELRTLVPGQRLSVAYRTLPVTVAPRDGDADAFVNQLNRLAAAGGQPPTAMVLVSDPTQGNIVIALPPRAVGEAEASTPGCTPYADAPFDAHAIASAYQLTYSYAVRRLNGQAPRRARIMVVDNGFFGADPENRDDPFQGSPFPRNYFARSGDPRSIIAARINVNTNDYLDDLPVPRTFIDPINYVHNLPVDDRSGHGTHVTGLTLGGPGFAQQRDQLRPAGDPWAEITILNVGKGGSGLVPGAHTQILNSLLQQPGPYVVNMSIAYEEDVSGIRTVFETLQDQGGDQVLFVVAAGNNAAIVSSLNLLPAALGGVQARNVITVSAHDAKLRVADFSNFDEDSVDVAAPGCGVTSWLSHRGDTLSMTGTSMAAPLVTFAAALSRSLLDDVTGRDLKNRIIVSGDLLADNDRAKTAYGGIRLNIAKSLFWFHDYVRRGDEELLGRVEGFPESALRCATEAAPRRLRELWSWKRRAGGTGVLFLGKQQSRVHTVCEARDSLSGALVFTPTHQVARGGIRELPKPVSQQIPLRDVNEIVFRSLSDQN